MQRNVIIPTMPQKLAGSHATRKSAPYPGELAEKITNAWIRMLQKGGKIFLEFRKDAQRVLPQINEGKKNKYPDAAIVHDLEMEYTQQPQKLGHYVASNGRTGCSSTNAVYATPLVEGNGASLFHKDEEDDP